MASRRAALAAFSRGGFAASRPFLLSSLSSASATPSSTAATAPCLRCQWRFFSASHTRRAPEPAEKKTTKPVEPARQPSTPPQSAESVAAEILTPQAPPSPLPNAPRSYGKRTDEFTPEPLSRPIGMPLPPLPGENSGIDTRSIRQRRDDLVDYDKHLERRKELKSKIVKPYFRDWSNLQFHKGKTFISPPRLFRGDLSLYFPNLVGSRLLASDKAVAAALSDTTPMIESHAATVVTLFSSMWAENQVKTFVSAEANPALAEVLATSGSSTGATNGDGTSSGGAQLVQVNIEENAMRAWLVRRFRGSLRRRIPERDWERYLLVTKGVSDSIRESIGLLNSKVGYVYLVDRHCRIRWAGSGPSEPEERQSLVKGVQRLLSEAKAEAAQLQQQPLRPRPARSETQERLARSRA